MVFEKTKPLKKNPGNGPFERDLKQQEFRHSCSILRKIKIIFAEAFFICLKMATN